MSLDLATADDAILEAIDAIRPGAAERRRRHRLPGASTPTASCTSRSSARAARCPVSMMTLKAGVERIIMDRVPGVTEVVADE